MANLSPQLIAFANNLGSNATALLAAISSSDELSALFSSQAASNISIVVGAAGTGSGFTPFRPASGNNPAKQPTISIDSDSLLGGAKALTIAQLAN